MEPVTSEELAYLAGIIDGEGSIGLHHRKEHPNSYRYYLQVTNTSLELIQWIQARFGGSLREGKTGVYQVTWHSKGGIYEMLEMVDEFLIVKKEAAEVMMDFCLTGSYLVDDRDLQCHALQKNKTGKPIGKEA